MKKTGITRKQAIKKMGKYAALTAIGTFAILNPKKAQASSTPPEMVQLVGLISLYKLNTYINYQ